MEVRHLRCFVAVAEELHFLFATSFSTPRTPPFLREWHRRRVRGMPGHVVAGCMTGLYEGDEGLGRAVVSREYLSARAVPRLVVCASEATADFERTLPLREADRVVVLNGGHFLHQERADDFTWPRPPATVPGGGEEPAPMRITLAGSRS